MRGGIRDERLLLFALFVRSISKKGNMLATTL